MLGGTAPDICTRGGHAPDEHRLVLLDIEACFAVSQSVLLAFLCTQRDYKFILNSIDLFWVLGL